MEETAKKMKVVYISGMPRSGSTLLGMCLGQLAGASDIGEFWALWRPAWRQRDLCGCGKPVNECSFWVQVVERALPSPVEVSGAQMGKLHKENLGSLRAAKVAFLSRSGTLKGNLLSYANQLSAHYKAICEVGTSHIVIDSSKMATDAFVISTIPDVDLYVIHLVRDPRGVAWSWAKSWNQPGEGGQAFDRYSAFGTAIRWVYYNLFSFILRNRVGPSRFRTIHYESLISDPLATLSELAVWMGEDPQSLTVTKETLSVRLSKQSHPAWGNPVRTAQEVVALKLDDIWRTNLVARRRYLVTLLCAPLLLWYRYPFFTKKR